MSPDTSTGSEPALATSRPAPAPRRRLWPWLVALLVIAAVAAAVWYAWPKAADAPSGSNTPGGSKGGRFDPAAAKAALPVVAAAAIKGSIDVYLNALGTVTPRNVVTVKPRVDGQLMSVSFSEGQIVKAGDLLAQIDPRPFQVALTQAIGQQAKDQALLKNAQLDLERYQTLLSQDSISKQQVDTQAALVRQYEGTVQSDQGAVDSAKLQLTYSRVTAPITGRVGLRQVDPGNVVHASDTTGLVVITQLQPMTVVFPIPEDDVPRVMKRMQDEKAVVVEAWDRDQKVKLASGKLLTVDNQIDPTTGTVKLKSEFANENLALFPNQFVNVRMLVQTLSDATLIPSAAIQRGAPGTFVYVVKADQTVSVVPVKLGPAQGEITAIASGLVPGDVVVTDGADKLREGAKVELITRDAQTPPVPGSGRRPQRGERGDKASGPRQAAGAPGNGQAPPKNGG
jgi:membrane fusion protein, multidrug efflux system